MGRLIPRSFPCCSTLTSHEEARKAPIYIPILSFSSQGFVPHGYQTLGLLALSLAGPMLSVMLHLCQLVQARSAGILCPMTLGLAFAMTKRRLEPGPVPSLYTEEHAGFRRSFPRITSQLKTRLTALQCCHLYPCSALGVHPIVILRLSLIFLADALMFGDIFP
ncbi:hypothetical protein IW261DRAFT_672667 [Armillaria novae-zelandiae]|uniref:Uncharacterized protein n=1 Tax=Armillaria novae-zelandiae TaxID=153914 RepID=A0AA39NXV1_9AGAR|nr:hypothetical protein IW261DRAFT_672667 [Armillaria novae-zelandiae]